MELMTSKDLIELIENVSFITRRRAIENFLTPLKAEIEIQNAIKVFNCIEKSLETKRER